MDSDVSIRRLRPAAWGKWAKQHWLVTSLGSVAVAYGVFGDVLGLVMGIYNHLDAIAHAPNDALYRWAFIVLGFVLIGWAVWRSGAAEERSTRSKNAALADLRHEFEGLFCLNTLMAKTYLVERVISEVSLWLSDAEAAAKKGTELVEELSRGGLQSPGGAHSANQLIEHEQYKIGEAVRHIRAALGEEPWPTPFQRVDIRYRQLAPGHGSDHSFHPDLNAEYLLAQRKGWEAARAEAYRLRTALGKKHSEAVDLRAAIEKEARRLDV